MDASIRFVYRGNLEKRSAMGGGGVGGICIRGLLSFKDYLLEKKTKKFQALLYLPFPFSGDSKGKSLGRYYERLSRWCFQDAIVQHNLVSSL